MCLLVILKDAVQLPYVEVVPNYFSMNKCAKETFSAHPHRYCLFPNIFTPANLIRENGISSDLFYYLIYFIVREVVSLGKIGLLQLHILPFSPLFWIWEADLYE